MVAVFVVFTSTVEFRISAVYMGRVPVAEHDSMPPCIANRAAGNVTIGGTNRLERKPFLSSSPTEPYLLIIILDKAHLAAIQANYVEAHIHTCRYRARSGGVRKTTQRKKELLICLR